MGERLLDTQKVGSSILLSPTSNFKPPGFLRIPRRILFGACLLPEGESFLIESLSIKNNDDLINQVILANINKEIPNVFDILN